MPRKRRFTAPLVLVVAACGQPPEPDEPWVERDPEAEPPPRIARAAPPDAGVIDAEPPDAMPRPPPDAWPSMADLCRRPPQESGVICNPPRSLVGKVINISASDAGTVIEIDLGSDDGLARGWSGALLDDHDRPRSDGRFVIIRLRARSAVAKLKLDVDQVQQSSLRVRIDPP